jgi:hypothetical protein
MPCILGYNSTYQNVFITSREQIDDLKLYTVAYSGGKTVYTKINDVDIIKGVNNIHTEADLTGISYDSINLFLFGSNMRPYMKNGPVSDTVVYKVTCENGFVYTDAFGDFSLPVAKKELYNFIGYYDNNDVRVTDENGNKLSDYNVTGNITLTAKFESAVTITYDENKAVKVDEDGNFTLPVPKKGGYKFIGYFDEDDFQALLNSERDSRRAFFLSEEKAQERWDATVKAFEKTVEGWLGTASDDLTFKYVPAESAP